MITILYRDRKYTYFVAVLLRETNLTHKQLEQKGWISKGEDEIWDITTKGALGFLDSTNVSESD